MGIFRHPAEIFLEGKPDLPVVAATGHDLGHRLCHRVDGAVIRAPGGQIGVKSITHHGHGVAVSGQHRQLGHHSLGLRHLILSAVRHEDRSRPDGTVEHLHQALLRADIQIRQRFQPFRPHVFHLRPAQDAVLAAWDIHGHTGFLMSPVGVQKRSGDIYDLQAAPHQHQPRFLCHHRHLCGFQVFLPGIGEESLRVARIYHHCHPFLGFRNCDLRPVQSRVFLRHLIQIYPKSIRQLSDGHRHAAGPKVVAFLDQTADFFSAEQTLDLAFRRRIPLLDLRPAGLNGFFRVDLGRTGGAAAAVPACPAAQQDDDISRIRGFPDHSPPGRRS